MPILTNLSVPYTDPRMEFGSDYRNTSYLVAHIGFFIFNLINFSILLFFEGYGTRFLWSNPVSKLSLAAHFLQMLSCYTSIKRFNENDEYGIYGLLGTYLGTAGFVLMITSYGYLLFQNNIQKIKVWSAAWTVLGLYICAKTKIDWEEVRFVPFQQFIVLTIAAEIFITLHARKCLKEGKIMSDVMSTDLIARFWEVLIALLVIPTLLTAAKLPVLSYPGTGVIHSCCMVNSMLVGRMSFMTDTRTGASSSSDERLPLRR